MIGLVHEHRTDGLGTETLLVDIEMESLQGDPGWTLCTSVLLSRLLFEGGDEGLGRTCS